MSCLPWNPQGCIGQLAQSAAGDAFAAIARDFAQAAASAVDWLWAQIATATAVRLGGVGFDQDLWIVSCIVATVAVGLFTIQVATSALRRDPSGLVRACRGLLVCFIGGAVAIAATNILLGAVDALSSGVVEATTGGSINQLSSSVLTGQAILSATSNPAALVILALMTFAAVFLVWAALMVRKVLLVVTAVFAPLAFAGSLADITSSWVRRWIETTVALIFSKLILVVIFVIGLGMGVAGSGQAGHGAGQQITQLLSGLLILTLAGFAPWVALKLVHFTGDQFHHLHLMASTTSSGAQQIAHAPQKAAALSSAAGRLQSGRNPGLGSRQAPTASTPDFNTGRLDLSRRPIATPSQYLGPADPSGDPNRIPSTTDDNGSRPQ